MSFIQLILKGLVARFLIFCAIVVWIIQGCTPAVTGHAQQAPLLQRIRNNKDLPRIDQVWIADFILVRLENLNIQHAVAELF